MHQLIMSTEDDDSDTDRRSKRKKLLVLLGLGMGLVIVILVIAGLAIWLPSRNCSNSCFCNGTDVTTKPTDVSTKSTGASTKATDVYTKSTVASTRATDVSTKSTGASARDTDVPTKSTGASTRVTDVSTKSTNVPTKAPDLCGAVELQKFDCHPDHPKTKDSCEKRGCCFRPASDLNVSDTDLISSRFVGVPSCFFPESYKGYELVSNINVGNDLVVKLKRVTPSGFPKDVQEVELRVTHIDNYRLRIKIKDAKSERFEPDVPVAYKVQEKTENSTYSVNFSSGGYLEVTRKSTGAPIFSTDLTRLIFSNQFLQLSTLVSSKYLYGLGEQKETVLKSMDWKRFTLFNQGDLPVANRNLYGSHPFYLVVEPGGESNGVFLLNSNAIDYILQPTPAVTIRPVGGILDFFLFLGPTPGQVVSQYTTLFGKPNFPPRWSLGFQICKYGYFSLNKTKEVLDRNLAAGIPIDVQWNDIDYMDRHLDFTYDPDSFEGLPEFVTDLHQNGRHYVAMISPGVSNTETPGTYSAFDDGKELDLFVKDTDGNYIEGKVWNDNTTVFPDFSNPVTVDYWKKQFKVFHSKLDFDGVWLDMNEPLNFMNGSSEECPVTEFDNPPYLPGRPYPLDTLTLCMSAQHNKTRHYNEHNLVGYRENKATHSVMVEITGKRPFLISRATFSGQGTYSGHWSGDITSNWDDLRYTIPAMLAFSLYGIPMTGSDICGFRLNTTKELCARWQSLGAFYPLSRNHNDFDTIEQDPAAMGSEVIESTKNALRVRYYLLPYLYTLFYRNHVYGETVARPLFFEFPKDEKILSVEDQFLWGPSLLIMPALEPDVDSITPYVPKGLWYDLQGKPYSSAGERIKFDANLTTINVLLRGGYILPAQIQGKTTMDSALNPFDVLVALDGDKKAEGELFWDDGETYNTYNDAKYNLIQMSAEKDTLKILPKKFGFKTDMNLRNFKVFGLNTKPTNVTVNDKETGYIFDEQLLLINATNYSLLDELTVKWF